MADNPYIPKYDVIDLEILIDGKNTGLHSYLKKAEIHYELNKIPFAKLRFLDSNNEQKKGEEDTVLKDNLIVLKPIEIRIKDEDGKGVKPKVLFKGKIYKTEQNSDSNIGVETKIECKDIVFDLINQQDVIPDETFETKMSRFLNKLDIKYKVSFSNWGNEIVSKTSNISPWDYILSFLDSLGFMSTVREGLFTVVDISEKAKVAAYLAQNGVNIFEFDGRAESTVSEVIIKYWDPESQSIKDSKGETDAANGVGSEVINLGQSDFSSETIDQLKKGRASKNIHASTKGRVKTFGNLSASYGSYISFDKVNLNIDGKLLLVSEEHHTIENGCWDTEYRFGLENNNSFSENIRSSATMNEDRLGQTNTVRGLQIGVVTKIDGDTKNQFRIKVRIPSISSTGEGVWARLSSVQAGPDRGAFFIPEVNDEVVLGCFNNNPDTPVILGNLYSSRRAMPFPLDADNYKQGIVTKTGSRILIDDEKKSIEISTKSGNKLLVSDAENGFVFENKNKSKIIVNNDGITLDSKKDIILKAAGNIKIEGMEHTLKANGNLTLNGAMIQLN